MGRVTHDVTDPTFPHGTEKGYFRGCHAECCLRGKRRTAKQRDMRKARGEATTVPVGPVREFMVALLAKDPLSTANAAARAAGVTPRTVSQVVSGETRERVRKVTADALLALTLQDVLAAAHVVRADRPRQQVQSMMRLGWTGRWISARLGHTYIGNGPPQFMYHHGTGGGPTTYMRRNLAERIARLAAEVGDRPGPSAKTTEYARRRGWHVPGAYDEDGTFLPWAVRGSDEIEDAKARKVAIAERREQVWALTADGLQPQEIADRLRTTADVVHADRRRGLSRQAERLLLAEARHSA